MSLVSVIVPTYNYAHYIIEAIDSVLEQTYPRKLIEIIVADDGSIDNTNEVLKEYIDNGLIHYFFQENKGKANATKNAVQIANGKYIFNLDADDYFYPSKIEETVRVFEEYPDVVHVGSPAKIIYQDRNEEVVESLPKDLIEKPIDGQYLLNRFYRENILFGGGSTYAARSSVLKSINIPDSVDMYIDEFLILAILPFGKSFLLGKEMSAWRVHNSNYSGHRVSKEKQKQKEERLLKSSLAVLKYINENKFDDFIKKIYRLKNTTRIMSFKEGFGKKSFGDILRYAYEVLFQIQPGLTVMKNYYVLNKCIPTGLYHLLKRIK